MNKAIKYRIYPTREQTILFAKTFGCCRKVYNLMLADKIASYQATKSFGMQTPAMYKQAHPYLKEVDSLALCNVQLHLQGAIRSCFDKKRKKQTGFPKFKSRKRGRNSYTTNHVAIVENRYIKLPKVGLVKAVIHRKPDADWRIKSATISQDGDGKYHASVLFAYDRVIAPVPVSGNAIGLDYASDGLYMDDHGGKGSWHKYYREAAAKLAKAQRRLARMVEHNTCGYKAVGNKRYPIYKKPLEDCRNIQKQKRMIARIHRHIANQRADYLHKASTGIANQYDVVCVESLDMRAMSNKGFGNGKATMDNGYGMFLHMLEYKLADRGKHFVQVDKWFPSSQLCHRCGMQHPAMRNLATRTFYCDCGLCMDRDHNAAINIKNEGLRLLTA